MKVASLRHLKLSLIEKALKETEHEPKDTREYQTEFYAKLCFVALVCTCEAEAEGIIERFASLIRIESGKDDVNWEEITRKAYEWANI